MSEDKDSFLKKKKFGKKIFYTQKKLKSNMTKGLEKPVKFIIQKRKYFKVQNFFEPPDKKNKNDGRWSNEEHNKFLKGLELYGINWKKFRNIIESRTLSQVRSHAQKFYLKMKLCKNENLGIDFTLNSIQNIKDMINQIKNNNNNYNIINIFQYLNNEYDNNIENERKKTFNKNIKKKINIEINNNDKNYNNIDFKDKLFNYNLINDNYLLEDENKEEELSLNEELNPFNHFVKYIDDFGFIK